MITSYQFIKYKEDNFIEYQRKLSELNTITCFDFEDSIMDFKTNNTNRYKTEYRFKIINLIKKYNSRILKKYIGFRINEYGTDKYYDDIQSILSFGNFKIRTIFLSNCNSVADLQRFISENENIRFSEVIPIIENNDAYSRLDEYASFKNPKFHNIAFGHCDFNMNCNIFPFIHQDNEKYWIWIEKFAEITKKNKIGFVNSQYLNINDNKLFKQMLSRMNLYFKDWGQITINTQQSELCYNYVSENTPINKSLQTFNANIDADTYAKTIVELFEKYNPSGKGYTIMPNTNTFISPQEYIAAKRYISEK